MNMFVILGLMGLAFIFSRKAVAVPAPKIRGPIMTDTTRIFKTPANGMQYEDSFVIESTRYNIPAGLLSRIALQESNYNKNAVSGAGAIGLMQFMPATAQEMGIDPTDPYESIKGAAQYLRWLFIQTGSWKLSLAAYNWGIGNIKRKGFNNAPQETRNYVLNIVADTGVV